MTLVNRFPIAVALDDSEYAEIVLEHALDQAKRHDAPELHAIAVVDDERDLAATEKRLARLLLEGLETFGPSADWRVRIHVRCGKPAREIAALAAECKAQLLVVGRYGTHGRRSLTDSLLELAPCPVLVLGLTGRDIEENLQCEACVAARSASDGETWFCSNHAAPGRMRLTTLVPPSTSTRGSVW